MGERRVVIFAIVVASSIPPTRVSCLVLVESRRELLKAGCKCLKVDEMSGHASTLNIMFVNIGIQCA